MEGPSVSRPTGGFSAELELWVAQPLEALVGF